MNIRTYMFSALVFLALSCAGDLGNYDYHDLTGPGISGLEADVKVMSLERLTLNPVISGGLGEDAYTYEWKAIDRNSYEVTVIGDARDLDYEVTLAPGLYSLYYTLTEKNTGIYWQKELSLSVSTPLTEGWMVLCADEGRARLDFISAVNGKTYGDLLKDNGTPQFNGPRSIHWQKDLSYGDSPFYLFTDDGATRLGKDNFDWKEEYRMTYEMVDVPNPLPYSMVSSGFGKLFVNGTDVHYCEVWSESVGGLYGSPVNKGFRASPYIGANVLQRPYAAVYLLYDIDNKRFMAYCPLLANNDLGAQNPLNDMAAMEEIAGGLASGENESVVGNAFGEYPEGCDMVYMENTLYDPGSSVAGITYSILADGGKRYVYGIQLGDMLFFPPFNYVLGKAYCGDISGCTGITEAEHFAFSSLKNCMYYSIGGTVYSVDLSQESPVSRVQFTLPGESISCLKFNLYKTEGLKNDSYDLVVVSNGADGGKLRIYEGYDSDGEFADVTPVVYGGFTEVVDALYKENVYNNEIPML